MNNTAKTITISLIILVSALTYFIPSSYGLQTSYLIPIYVYYSGNTTVYNYTLHVYISSSSPIANQINWNVINASNIYFIDDNGKPLYFYIYRCDPALKIIDAYVNITLYPNTNETIYMGYGLPSNPYPSYNNPDRTFLFYEDFLTDPNTNGKWIVFRSLGNTSAEFVWDSNSHFVHLTMPVNNAGVLAVINKPITPPFQVSFYFSATSGADGITFFFEKDIQPFYSSNPQSGGSLALIPSTSNSNTGYAIEFDQYQNDNEPSVPHIAFINTSVPNPYQHIKIYYSNAPSDGSIHHVVVDVNSTTVLVYLDGSLIIKSSYTPYSYPWIGFTGSCGGLTAYHNLYPPVMVTRYVDPSTLTVTYGNQLQVVTSTVTSTVTSLVTTTYTTTQTVSTTLTSTVTTTQYSTVTTTYTTTATSVSTTTATSTVTTTYTLLGNITGLISNNTSGGAQVYIPSLSSVAVTDALAVTVITAVELGSLFYYVINRHSRRARYIVMVLTIIALFSSIALMGARSVVPVGYKTVNNSTGTYIQYIYGANPFAKLYLVPIAVSFINVVLIVIDMIREAMGGGRYKYSGYIMWGR